jgi:hypothetical protein
MHFGSMSTAEMLGFGLAATCLIAYLFWYYARSRRILETWAAENGYELLHANLRHIFRGPFFWNSSKSQTVYYVRVLDGDGRQRVGWVLCGSYLTGVFSKQAEVRWDN